MSRTNRRGIGSRIVGAAAIASALLIATLVGGTGHLDSASATSKPAMGKLEVCTSERDTPSLIGVPFSFTESKGRSTVGPFSVDAAAKADVNCGGLTKYPVGTKVNIAELPNSSGVQVETIHVANGTASNVNLPAGTATVTVGASTVITKVNYANGIPGGRLASIEVCVLPGDKSVTGSFTFGLSEGKWSDTLPPVPANQCSGDVTVRPGQVTVTEEPSSPYDVSSVGSIPQSALVSEDLAKGEATYSVGNGSSVTAIFTNSTVTSGTVTQEAPISGTVTPGNPFTDQLNTNDVSPVTFTVTSSHPAFTVSSSGAVSAPDTLAVGTYTVSGTDSDGLGNTGTWVYTLTVGGPPPIQTAPTSGTVVAGHPFTSQLHTTGVSPVTFTVTSSSPAFTVSSSGAVSAPDTLAVGFYTVSGTDRDELGDTGTWSFTLTVT